MILPTDFKQLNVKLQGEKNVLTPNAVIDLYGNFLNTRALKGLSSSVNTFLPTSKRGG